jgi:hypothetical protein
MFKVICIDASFKPEEVPTSSWLVEGQEYTVLRVGKNKLTNEDYFILQEIQPNLPYGGYKVNRFRLPHPDAIDAQYEKQVLENSIF